MFSKVYNLEDVYPPLSTLCTITGYRATRQVAEVI